LPSHDAPDNKKTVQQPTNGYCTENATEAF